MDSQQLAEEPTRNTLWLKLLIAFLAVAAIGQISVIFLPAAIGQSPAPFSLFGSILWLGLLFMYIWSLKEKSKMKGFLVGALIGFLLHFFAGFTAGYLKAEERAIDKAVAASNEGLPKMIDEETRLDAVSRNGTRQS